jgi:hypothetical protein
MNRSASIALSMIARCKLKRFATDSSLVSPAVRFRASRFRAPRDQKARHSSLFGAKLIMRIFDLIQSARERDGELDRDAIKAQPEPPCTGCPSFARCAGREQACEAFHAFVNEPAISCAKYRAWRTAPREPSRAWFEKVYSGSIDAIRAGLSEASSRGSPATAADAESKATKAVSIAASGSGHPLGIAVSVPGVRAARTVDPHYFDFLNCESADMLPSLDVLIAAASRSTSFTLPARAL